MRNDLKRGPKLYTADHMTSLITGTQKLKSAMRTAGRLDELNNPIPPPEANAEDKKVEPVTHEAYCVKCKSKKTVETEKIHHPDTSKPGRAIGGCPTCGTKTHAFKSAKDAKQLSDALQSTLAQTGGV